MLDAAKLWRSGRSSPVEAGHFVAPTPESQSLANLSTRLPLAEDVGPVQARPNQPRLFFALDNNLVTRELDCETTRSKA